MGMLSYKIGVFYSCDRRVLQLRQACFAVATGLFYSCDRRVLQLHVYEFL